MKLLFIVFVALIVGCTHAKDGEKKLRVTEKDAEIYEVVLRYAFLNNVSSLKSRADFYVVELNGEDAPSGFIARFDNIKKPIYPLSKAKLDCKKGVYLKNDDQRGLQFFVDQPEYESETKVKISWGYSEGCTSSAMSIMKLEFKNGSWVVLDSEIIVIS